MLMPFKKFLALRPISFIALMSGLKDVVLGIGFVSSVEHVTKTQLYMHYDALWPHLAGPIVGLIFLVVGLLISYFALKGNLKAMARSLKVQALLWLFSTISYVLFGQFVFAIMLGLFFCILAGYLAYQVS